MAHFESFAQYDTINEAATAFINSFVEAHKAQDPTLLSSSLTSSCRRYLAPGTIIKQAPQVAAGWSNAEYENHMRAELLGYSKVEPSIQDIIIDVRKREAVVRSTHTCTMASDGRVWVFEFMFILRCDESGSKIREITEFVDTATAGEFMAAYMPSKA